VPVLLTREKQDFELFYLIGLPEKQPAVESKNYLADYLDFLKQDLLGKSLVFRTHEFLVSKITGNKNYYLEQAGFLVLGLKDSKDIDYFISRISLELGLKKQKKIFLDCLKDLKNLDCSKGKEIFVSELGTLSKEPIFSKNLTSFSGFKKPKTKSNKIIKFFLKQKIRELQETGVNLISSKNLIIAPEVKIGRGTTIYPNSYFLGKTRIGEGCEIGPNSWIKDSDIKKNSKITFSYLEKCTIGENCQVGPFSHLREKSILKKGVRIGNFVETKNIEIDTNSKACHLSYLGDSKIGKDVNIGAGTVIANYDPVSEQKNFSEIKDKSKIGSNTVLVSPITLEKETFVGAGSVITKSSQESKSLLISRNNQVEIKDWFVKKKNSFLLKQESSLKKKKINFLLIGMMLTGKTNLGKFWAKEFDFEFLDFDQLIEQSQKKTIKEIIESYGENYFRKLETELLKKISLEQDQTQKYLYSTGGGIVKTPENYQYLKTLGKIIWLKSKPETILKRLEFKNTELSKRPLLKDLDSLPSKAEKIASLKKIILERESLYRKFADFQIETDQYDLDLFKEKFLRIFSKVE